MLRIIHFASCKEEREWNITNVEMWLDLLTGLHLQVYLRLVEFRQDRLSTGRSGTAGICGGGVRQVLSYMDETDSAMVTVSACGYVAGEVLRSLLISDGKVNQGSRFDTDNDCYVEVDNSGVVDANIFTKNVCLEFTPHMKVDEVFGLVRGLRCLTYVSCILLQFIHKISSS